jgi:hypothetical protein
MKLFKVTTSVSYVLASPNPSLEEVQWALDQVIDDTLDYVLESPYQVSELTSLSDLPNGWSDECIPYGHANDQTIRDIFFDNWKAKRAAR